MAKRQLNEDTLNDALTFELKQTSTLRVKLSLMLTTALLKENCVEILTLSRPKSVKVNARKRFEL
jgi:hypothetical protein